MQLKEASANSISFPDIDNAASSTQSKSAKMSLFFLDYALLLESLNKYYIIYYILQKWEKHNLYLTIDLKSDPLAIAGKQFSQSLNSNLNSTSIFLRSPLLTSVVHFNLQLIEEQETTYWLF